MSDPSTRWRPWLAAGLSLLVPGLGHAYLRRWARLVAWIGFMIVFVVVVFAVLVFQGMELPQEASTGALLAFYRRLPASVNTAGWLANGLIAIDAFVIARAGAHQQRSESGDRCSDCGKALDDPDLSFCPWCGADLDDDVTQPTDSTFEQ